MSISETSVRDAELLAISEINGAGGVLGKQIVAVQADGASDPQVFSAEARRLIQNEKVVSVFGCWTSASRKAVKPVVEEPKPVKEEPKPQSIPSISDDKLSVDYIQALLDKIESLEEGDPEVNKEEINALNAELDAIITILNAR